MATKRKSWQEKLMDSKGLPKIVEVSKQMAGRWGAEKGETLLIPAPVEVDGIMKKVPPGKVITINEIRAALARKHQAAICCPLTTGIFSRIAAEAAAEAASEGKKNTTPYWRTLKSGGILNEKYPGGVENQRRLLEKEGHRVIQKGKKYLVVDLERSLVELQV